MSPNDWASSVNGFVQAIGKEGAFALGTLMGCLITGGMNWLASRNNNKRLQIDLEREKALYAQLKMKDDRINKLHDQVGAHLALPALAGKKK